MGVREVGAGESNTVRRALPRAGKWGLTFRSCFVRRINFLFVAGSFADPSNLNLYVDGIMPINDAL